MIQNFQEEKSGRRSDTKNFKIVFVSGMYQVCIFGNFLITWYLYYLFLFDTKIQKISTNILLINLHLR